MTGREAIASQKSVAPDAHDLRPPPLSTSRAPSIATRPKSPPPQTLPHLDQMPGNSFETPDPSATNLVPSPDPPSEPQVPAVPEDHTSSPSTAKDAESRPGTGYASTDADDDSEAHRPGLGPMIKKKLINNNNKGDLANTFRKAATAYNAFRPRAGGAGERLKQGGNETQEPDGINAVVPAPLRKKSVDIERTEPPPSLPKEVEQPPIAKEQIPEVEVTSPLASPEPQAELQQEHKPVQLKDEPASQPTPAPAEVQLAPTPEPRRPKRRSAQQENYLRTLNIDPRLLDGRGIEFESILTDFGWGTSVMKGRQLEDLEADLKRELGRIEAGSWLGHLEQKDDRVEIVDQMLDRAIAECDELEGLLTLYAVELGSLNDDIAFIEAQSQGLQVQTANQKILHAELQKLVDTISITPQQLQPLRYGSFDDPRGLSEIEQSLLLLYRAMVTIDPSIRSSSTAISSDLGKSTLGLEKTDIGTMNALQEKRQAYLQESASFCQQLMRYLDTTFEQTLAGAKLALMQSPSGLTGPLMKLNGPAYNSARANLFQFSPLLLFAKELNQPAWQALLRMYGSKARPLYTDVFRENTQAWKKGVRKATGDVAELLFTSVEKETSEGLTSTARRITVKRSQTLAKTFRAASGDKSNVPDARQAGRLMPCEVFAGVMEEQAPLLRTEQNFIVDLFHTTSLENIDFADAVLATIPETRTSPDLTARRLMEPDRIVARHVADTMEELFGFWATEMRGLIEWAVAEDPM